MIELFVVQSLCINTVCIHWQYLVQNKEVNFQHYYLYTLKNVIIGYLKKYCNKVTILKIKINVLNKLYAKKHVIYVFVPNLRVLI